VSALRVVGALFAVLLFVVQVRRYSRRNASRLNLIVTGIISLLVLLLAIQPNWFNPILSNFGFNEGNNQRLIGVLMVGEIILFALILRNWSEADAANLSIRLLVESLAVQSFDWEAAKRLPDVPRAVVVLPAFNESENIGSVLHAMPEEVEGLLVVPVVVDDGSEDDTAGVARAGGALVARHPIRRGGGLAMRVGYEIGIRLNADVVVTMDADGQHVPDEMPLLVKPIVEGQADLVNGSRVLGEFERESLVRHVGVHFFSRIVTIMIGTRITDVSNGYRAVRTDVLRNLQLDQDQFWASELLIEGMRHRLRIVEVPITIRARQGGESKKPKNWKYGWHFAKAIVKTWLR
jgi:hypothetical protein